MIRTLLIHLPPLSLFTFLPFGGEKIPDDRATCVMRISSSISFIAFHPRIDEMLELPMCCFSLEMAQVTWSFHDAC